ncbi:MAG: GspH/FimT family pseudopilin [Thermoanaerobaculia bacterium]|nr:GspH/FimT family pseudopilin [Thermoanaerobaculia bacterium]
MTRNRFRRPTAGFTLFELLVVIAVIGILLGIAVPALVKQIGRSQLLAAARETGVLMQKARMEAIRRGVPVVVAPDATGRTLVGWVNSERNAAGQFVDLDFDETAGELRVGEVRLAARIVMRGPGDAAVNGEESNLFDRTPPGPADDAPSPPFVADLPVEAAVFMPNGSVLVDGAFRFTEDDARNFLEVRVAPRGTARVVVRKFNPSGPVAGELWYESGLSAGTGPGTGRNVWEWY